MRKKVLTTACAALAAVAMVSGFWMTNQTKVDTSVPQLVSYVDSLDGTITIEGEETPLAAKPVVKKKTTTKKTTQKIKMPAKAKKSSKKKTKKTVKTSSTKVSSTQKVKTDQTILTTAVTSLKKNSKVKTIKTTVKTTTKTTTTKITAAKKPAAASTNNANSSSATKNTVVKKTVALKSIAPKAHANVLSAYEKMSFGVYVDSTVNYSGKFDARAQLITLQKNSDDAVYHELGHFVAFVAGNADQTAEFKAIYDKEKSKFEGTRNNDAYIKSTAAEYFAESYQDYVERPDVLKSARPQTYKFVVESVAKVTDARAAFLTQLYGSIWK